MNLQSLLKFLFRSGSTLIFSLILNINSISAQLRIYQGAQQTGTFADCVVSTIYKGVTIPSSLDNQIASIRLTKGYMATLAENEDGTGNSYPFMAVTSDISVDLNNSLKNKVSFIRVLPLKNTLKKGAGYKSPDSAPNDNSVVDKLNVSWLYDWGANDVSTSTREYAIMAWGRNAANQTNVNNYIAKTDITHLLSFNEPDNANQSNISVVDAVSLHRNLEATGYRLGSPAPEENNAQTGRWLGDFMASTSANNIRVDYVAIHWYDWGSYSSTLATAPNVTNLFNRFKAYVNNIYNTYQKPIWITEFNANRNTTEQTHIDFINLALPWLEAQPFVERYAYFFPPALPPVDASGNLTPIGTAYSNYTSTALAISSNKYIGTLSSTPTFEAEDATLTEITSITNCASGSGGKIVPAITGTQRVTFNNVSVPSTANYKLKLFYFSKNIARDITIKVNGNAANTISIPGTTNWCFEGAAGTFETIISLNVGNNTIEFSEAPILDKIEIVEIENTMPISLVDFSAETKDYGIKLKWQTAQEVNNQYFELLRADDKKEFKVITKINGAVNSHSPQFYNFTDFNPATGTNYYQLKQYDIDGKFEIFHPIAIKFGLSADEFKVLNTSETSVEVSLSSSTAKKGIISYIGLDGRVLYKQKVNLTEGLNTFTIPVSKSSGLIGVISFIADGKQKALKISR